MDLLRAIDFRTNKLILTTVVALAVSLPAEAWNIQEDHDTWALIRCSDGSSARVDKLGDGSWTATQAGKSGKTGGSFVIVGKAALYACGE